MSQNEGTPVDFHTGQCLQSVRAQLLDGRIFKSLVVLLEVGLRRLGSGANRHGDELAEVAGRTRLVEMGARGVAARYE